MRIDFKATILKSILTCFELGQQSTQAKKLYLRIPSGSDGFVFFSRQNSLHDVLSQYLVKRAKVLAALPLDYIWPFQFHIQLI